MRRALEPILGRTATEGEIDALISLWRHDGQGGAAATADRVMRESFARFRREHPKLAKTFRRRISKQWIKAGRRARWSGDNLGALRFLIRAACWF